MVVLGHGRRMDQCDAIEDGYSTRAEESALPRLHVTPGHLDLARRLAVECLAARVYLSCRHNFRPSVCALAGWVSGCGVWGRGARGRGISAGGGDWDYDINSI